MSEGQLLTFAREILLRRIEQAEASIWLASPFLSAPIATRLRRAADKSAAAQKRLLTALDTTSVQCRALDPNGLLELFFAGFSIRSISNLHAKASLVDSTWGLIGSGNLTLSGLGFGEGSGNYEMGVVLAGHQIDDALGIFDRWWKMADDVRQSDLDLYAALPELPSLPAGRSGSTLAPPCLARLEEILAEDSATSGSRSYWINSNYHDPASEQWWRRNWVSDANRKTYDVGDLLVVYLGKKRGGPQRCPAVLRVEEPCVEDREFVRMERDAEAAEKWPFVTRTSCVAEVLPWDGVPLSAAGKNHLQVENGCKLTRQEFEGVALALLGDPQPRLGSSPISS